MIPKLIWSCYFFVLLIHGCVATKMYKPVDYSRVHNQRREVIEKIANNDPCSKRMWPFMDENEKKRGKRKCEEAYNNFVGLPPKNQGTCPDAASPECRALPVCEHLIYGCTFLCDFGKGEREKSLKEIFNEISNAVGSKRKAYRRHGDEPDPDFQPKRYERSTSDIILLG